MTAWTEIADPTTTFGVGKPITSEHGQLFYNNPKAMAEGATGAPRFSTRGIHPGGSETDGALTNATTITGIGFADFTSFTRSSALSVPSASVIRVNGDLTLSAAITVGSCDHSAWLSAELAGFVRGEMGSTGVASTEGGVGAASIGNGGIECNGKLGARGRNSTLLRPWSSLRGIVGGPCVDLATYTTRASGGGGLILIVHGNADFTGGTITADGTAGTGSNGSGGGGGGSIIVICTGTITGGTFNARGGTGQNSGVNNKGGGGGGGLIQLVASAFSGTQTVSVAGGSATSGATAGASGLSGSLTLTEAQINALVTR